MKVAIIKMISLYVIFFCLLKCSRFFSMIICISHSYIFNYIHTVN